MKLVVQRKYRKDKYTIGKLFVDGVYFCDTLEDPDRGLDNSMSLSQILKIKIKGDTAIPYGKYNLSLSIVSPKYSNFARFPYAKIANGKMPRVMGIKGFDGVLIHAGNSARDTMGCLLVGENKVKGQVINSQATWTRLYKKLQTAKGDITIEYTK